MAEIDHLERGMHRFSVLLVEQDKHLLAGEEDKPLGKNGTQLNIVSVANVDNEGNILDSREIGRIETSPLTTANYFSTMLDNGRFDFNKFALQRRPFLEVGFEQVEQIAQAVMHQLSDEEFTQLRISHEQLGTMLMQKQKGLNYNKSNDIVIQKEADQLLSQQDVNPFFDSKENLFLHVKQFLTAFISDEALKEKITSLNYEDIRHKVPVTLSQRVNTKYSDDMLANEYGPSKYDSEAKLMASELMQSIVRKVDPEQQITDIADIKALSREQASIYPNDASILLSFDDGIEQLSRDIATDERTRKQTFQSTSRKLLQDAYELGSRVISQEIMLRVYKSPDFDRNNMFVIYPAFEEDARQRQAEQLSHYSTEELMRSLPSTMWNVVTISNGAPYHFTLEDTDRLIDIYAQAISNKLLREENTLDPKEIEQLEGFANQLRGANVRVEALLRKRSIDTAELEIEPDGIVSALDIHASQNSSLDALYEQSATHTPFNSQHGQLLDMAIVSQVIRSPNRYLGYILEGTPPDQTVSIFIHGTEGELLPETIVTADKGDVAKLLTDKSQLIAQHRQKGLYVNTYDIAQRVMYDAANQLEVGIASYDRETGAAQFTQDYFLLPAGVQMTPVERISNSYQFSQERVSKVLAYNLLEAMDSYRRQASSSIRTNDIVLKDSIQTISGDGLKTRIDNLKKYAELIVQKRDDLDVQELWADAYDIAVERSVRVEMQGDKKPGAAQKIIEQRQRSEFLDAAMALSGIEKAERPISRMAG